MTTISGWVKCYQFGGFRKAGSDNPLSRKTTAIRINWVWRSRGEGSPNNQLESCRLWRIRSLQKMIYRKMHDGICPLESWQTEHSWRHGSAVISGKIGRLRFMFSLLILRFRLNYMTSNQIKRTISFSQICTSINFTASCYTSYCTYTVSVLCSLLLQ